LAAKSGDIITVGQGDFTVAGILQTENGFEDGGVFLPLKTAQTFFSRGGISSIIAITLRDEAQGAAFQAAVAAAYPKLLALENREFNQAILSSRFSISRRGRSGFVRFSSEDSGSPIRFGSAVSAVFAKSPYCACGDFPKSRWLR